MDGKNDTPTSGIGTVQQTCFTDLACPAAHVSAFCRAVISKVIPEGFWGNEHNKRILMYWVDQFIALRRFESVNLHQVTQKIKVCTSLPEDGAVLMELRSRIWPGCAHPVEMTTQNYPSRI
jgi:hypothetical protein